MRKTGIILLSLISLVFAITGIVTFVACLNSYASLNITMGTIIQWVEDTILTYNTNLAAKGNVIFIFVLALIIALSFIVYLVLVIKKKQYLSLIPVVLFALTGLLACFSYFYFCYADYNFGLYASVALIDIDYFLVIITSLGFAVSVANFVLVNMELVSNNKKKYDPLTIYHF